MPLDVRRTPNGGVELTGSLPIQDAIKALLDFQAEMSHNTASIFPEDSDETVTFAAGGVDNTFGAWVEIVDNNAVAFTSKLTADGHVTGLVVEEASVDDKIYIVEVAYGTPKVFMFSIRFRSGTKFLGVVQPACFVSVDIPTGEIIYYRMKCETGGATAKVHFRYILHS